MAWVFLLGLAQAARKCIDTDDVIMGIGDADE
jgi:hypothetical protein